MPWRTFARLVRRQCPVGRQRKRLAACADGTRRVAAIESRWLHYEDIAEFLSGGPATRTSRRHGARRRDRQGTFTCQIPISWNRRRVSSNRLCSASRSPTGAGCASCSRLAGPFSIPRPRNKEALAGGTSRMIVATVITNASHPDVAGGFPVAGASLFGARLASRAAGWWRSSNVPCPPKAAVAKSFA